MPREEWKRKRQKQPVQGSKQGRKRLSGPLKETPKSSARPIEKRKRENLTLSDWMTVYAYVDTLPQPVNQGAVVKYFATRPEGALLFTQPTLSRKLRHRSEMEARVDSNPNALSSKRPRIVTRPDVDRALWLWVRQMEQKREVVSNKMLIAKRAVFEEELNVPEDERLPGVGWVQSFCHAYGCKEIRKHGEGGSVNVEAVKPRMKGLPARLQSEDSCNVDESAHSAPDTLDEFLDPEEEEETEESPHAFEAGDAEIVAAVKQDMDLARDDIEEIDSDSDDPEVVLPSLEEMIKNIRFLEENAMLVCTEGSYEFVQAARRYRGHLVRMSKERAMETTL